MNSGARMRTWHYLRGLSRAGRVFLICGGTKDDKVMEAFAQQCRLHDRTHSSDSNDCPLLCSDVIFTGEACDAKISLTVRLLALLSALPCAVLARVSPRMRDLAEQVAVESQCDVIVCDGIHMALNVPTDVACRRILDEHNVESTIIQRFLRIVKNPLVACYVFMEWIKFRWFEQRMWPQFDEIHVCSAVDQVQVEKRCGHSQVCVVPNGVDVEKGDGHLFQDSRMSCEQNIPLGLASPELNVKRCPSPFSLVYSGLMGWQPNNDAALYFLKDIYPRIKASLASASKPADVLKFFIVGKQPSDAVKRLAQQDASITVTGWVEDVAVFLDQADVVVVPLRIGSGTRLKILEAMAKGRPVVSTSIGCEGLEVAHGENILIADHPKDFADCVVALFNDASLRRRIASAGRALVEQRYDWKKIESDLAKLVEKKVPVLCDRWVAGKNSFL